MCKVWQVWNTTHTQECYQSSSHTTKIWARIMAGTASHQSTPWGCGIWYEVPVVMDGLPPISHALWMHMKCQASLRHNPYTWIPSIQAADHQKCGPRFGRNFKNNEVTSMVVWIATRSILRGNVWVSTYFTCLVGVWRRSDTHIPGTQLINCDAIHPVHRPPKMWTQIMTWTISNQVTPVVMWVVVWSTIWHE